ncbi:MAG: hypothetical protein Q7J45_00620 [bacterium]|nr:hypothetical protein [bacterium]
MNILPANIKLIVAQGTTYRARFRPVSPSVPASYINGVWISTATGLPLNPSQVVPADLTGKGVRAAMRKNHNDATPAIAFNADNGNVFIDADPTTGLFGFDFTPETTSPLKATDEVYLTDPEDGSVISRCTKYVYDAEIFDLVTGEVTRPVSGQVVLIAEVTR